MQSLFFQTNDDTCTKITLDLIPVKTCTAYQYVPSYFRASTNGGLCIKIALSPKINFIIFFKSLELKLKLGT